MSVPARKARWLWGMACLAMGALGVMPSLATISAAASTLRFTKSMDAS